MINKEKKLFKSTMMLYLMKFSNIFFSLIIIPYQTRILGPFYYGKVVFATAVMLYFQLFTDFGFILSATEEVARYRDNKKKLGEIFTSVTILKIILGIMSVIILLGICFLSSNLREDFILYLLYLISIIIYSFLPDYLYRGLEELTTITYRTVVVRLISTIMILVLLKKPEDYLIIPMITAFGNFLAVILAYYHVSKKLKINFCKVSLEKIYRDFKSSATFFLSIIAPTIYSATNIMILGIIDKTGSVIGYYTASDKLISSGKSILSPIADSAYPYMIKHRDFKLIKKMLLIFMPMISLGSIIIFIFSKEVCILFFGNEFEYTSSILRAMMPMAIITLPSYLFGFPTLGAMGLSNYANKSIYFATIINIITIIIFYLLGYLNVITLALISSFTDGIVLAYRIFIVYRNRNILNERREWV